MMSMSDVAAAAFSKVDTDEFESLPSIRGRNSTLSFRMKLGRNLGCLVSVDVVLN